MGGVEVRMGSSTLEEEDAGRPWLPREMLDIRLSQEVGLVSLRSDEESLSEDQNGKTPCLVTELSLDCAPLLAVEEDGVMALTVFRLRIEVDMRRSAGSGRGGGREEGYEVTGRDKNEGSGVIGERIVGLEPGAFLLPGLMR